MKSSYEEKCCPFFSIYLSIYLYQYDLTGIYFADYNLIQSLFILLFKLFQLWSSGMPADWLSCVFSICLSFFEQFLTCWCYKMCQAHLAHSLSLLWNQSLLRSSGSLYWRIVFRNQDLGP